MKQDDKLMVIVQLALLFIFNITNLSAFPKSNNIKLEIWIGTRIGACSFGAVSYIW